MSLSALDLDVLRVCAIEDWTSPDGERAWRELRRRWGYNVNEAPVRAHLYRLGLLDVSDRVTFLGRVELWHADIMREAS
jgi:hypothetical protein